MTGPRTAGARGWTAGELALMAAAGPWALLVWTGRVSLLTGAEQADVFTCGRVAGSLILAGALLLVMWRSPASSPAGWLLAAFASWTILLWLPALVAAWSTEHGLGFRLVHTVLAVTSIGFGLLLGRVARRVLRHPRRQLSAPVRRPT